MPFVIKVDEDSTCLLTLWTGPFSSADNMSYNQALSRFSATQIALPRLHDAREVDFHVSVEEIHKTRPLNSGNKDDNEHTPRLHSAVLVRSDLDYGMMRIFSAIYNRPELDLRVFRELDKAKEWVGISAPGDPFETMVGNSKG